MREQTSRLFSSEVSEVDSCTLEHAEFLPAGVEQFELRPMKEEKQHYHNSPTFPVLPEHEGGTLITAKAHGRLTAP